MDQDSPYIVVRSQVEKEEALSGFNLKYRRYWEPSLQKVLMELNMIALEVGLPDPIGEVAEVDRVALFI